MAAEDTRLLPRESRWRLWSNYGPVIVSDHAKTAFGSHPRRVFSISYQITGFFHGGNTGSNPVGDANSTSAMNRFKQVLP